MKNWGWKLIFKIGIWLKIVTENFIWNWKLKIDIKVENGKWKLKFDVENWNRKMNLKILHQNKKWKIKMSIEI